MYNRESRICPLCHGTGLYEEKNVGKPNKSTETKKVKCESCEGTGSISTSALSSYWIWRALGSLQ